MADPTSTNSTPTVFLDGRFMPASEARLPVLHQGVMNGIGFYETFRTSRGRPHLWAYHQARLQQACGRAGIELPTESLATTAGRLREVIQQMLNDAGASDAVFRYNVLAGAADRDDMGDGRAHELLTMRQIPPTAPAEGVVLRVLTLPRDSGEWVPRPKSINQLNAQLGAAELRHRGAGPHDEGLFLSRDGCVVETTRQNVAWIRDGRLCYPDPSAGPVNGTCLTWVLDRALPAKPCRASVGDLASADAVVVMNSVRGITPVCELRDRDNRVLATKVASHENPLVVSLRHQWNEALEATGRTD
jgi:4-amino-4-deoxychorismate lyase